MGVPARIMAPRLLLLAAVAALVGFGLLMIFSASSVSAVTGMGDAWYYVKRQAIFAGIGLLLACAVAYVDYHRLCGNLLLAIWALTVLVLIAVFLAGDTTLGATRWITIAGFRFQPTEFAKITVLLAAVNLANAYFGEGSIDGLTLLKRLVLFVGVPLALIFVQPDKGSAGIIAIMVYAVARSAGLPLKVGLVLLAVAVAGALFVALKDDYSRQRVLTMLDPWLDPYDSGLQLVRGFMAFGSGGIFGAGLGMSRMKYSYLPMAHNDFIFAVVGEEFGLAGALAVIALFAVLAVEGIKVARNANDLTGRLLATGAVTLLVAQFFLNALGVLGLFPLSGKPMPFLSYGGSSIMSCLMIVGVIVNVSIHSELPETVHDARRRAMRVADDEPTGVGEARPRSGRAGLAYGDVAGAEGSSVGGGRPVRALRSGSVPLASPEEARRGFRVVDGGASSGSGGGFERIDLGPTASERLRPGSRTSPGGRGSGGSGRSGSTRGTSSGRTTRRR